MLYRDIARILGTYLSYFAWVLFIPLGLAFYYQYVMDPKLHPQPHSTLAFTLTIFVSFSLGFLLKRFSKGAYGKLYRKEALILVVLIWFITAFIAALPFYFSGTLKKPLDAYFEAMSGLTTTGASIMAPKKFDVTGKEIPLELSIRASSKPSYQYYGTINPVKDIVSGQILFEGIEAVSFALIFWRSFIQWLGGMGIVVLFVSVLPALGVGGKILYQAEVPGPSKSAITPRIKETASILWKLYLAMTGLEIFLLLFTNEQMTLFHACVITFSNLSTGGFSALSGSVGGYQSAYTEWIVVLFMIAGGTNFSLYFYCLKGKFHRILDWEFFIYLLTLFLGSIFISYHLIGTEKILMEGKEGIFSLGQAIQYGFFQMISAQTSTGFVTANYEQWPFVNQVVLLLSMYVGGMSGSTGGGIKVIRYFMLFRIIKNRLELIFRPETVRANKVGEHSIDHSTAMTVLCFFVIVIALSGFGVFCLTLDGVDPESALSINVCMINNIGIAFRAAGPDGTFAFLNSFSKIISILWMVLGRLEFFAVLVVLLPSFWKKG